MNDTIEILDKDTNTKQVYILKDELDKEEIDQGEVEPSFWFDIFPVIVKAVIKLAIKLFKFSLYLIISFLELLIKIIKTLFLNEYNPLGFISEAKDRVLDDRIKNRVKKDINQERIKFTTEWLTRHTYEFERSNLYSNTYKSIQEKLKDFADNNIAINEDIYKDILKKIDILTVEVEKKALQEGYSYAAYTKYKLKDDEVYTDFIQFKIMRGEGNSKADKKQGESTD